MMLPNLVFNIVEITGDHLNLLELKKALQGFDPTPDGKLIFSDFCLNNIAAIPSTKSQIQLERYRMIIWGCASDALGIGVSLKKGLLRYYFTTGCHAPEALIRKLSVQFKSLEINHQYKESL